MQVCEPRRMYGLYILYICLLTYMGVCTFGVVFASWNKAGYMTNRCHYQLAGVARQMGSGRHGTDQQTCGQTHPSMCAPEPHMYVNGSLGTYGLTFKCTIAAKKNGLMCIVCHFINRNKNRIMFKVICLFLRLFNLL